MTLEEIFALCKARRWLVSIEELHGDCWIVVFQLKNEYVMSTHQSWGLLETLTYNISKMEIAMNDHEQKQAKNAAKFIPSIPAAPLQRRI